jgi:hypothetical protein
MNPPDWSRPLEDRHIFGTDARIPRPPPPIRNEYQDASDDLISPRRAVPVPTHPPWERRSGNRAFFQDQLNLSNRNIRNSPEIQPGAPDENFFVEEGNYEENCERRAGSGGSDTYAIYHNILEAIGSVFSPTLRIFCKFFQERDGVWPVGTWKFVILAASIACVFCRRLIVDTVNFGAPIIIIIATSLILFAISWDMLAARSTTATTKSTNWCFLAVLILAYLLTPPSPTPEQAAQLTEEAQLALELSYGLVTDYRRWSM